MVAEGWDPELGVGPGPLTVLAKGIWCRAGTQAAQPGEGARAPLVAAESTFRGTWGRRLGATNPAPHAGGLA